MLAPK